MRGTTAILLLALLALIAGLAACEPAPQGSPPTRRPDPTSTPTTAPTAPPPTGTATPAPTLPPTADVSAPVATVTDVAVHPCVVLTITDVQSIAPWVESAPDAENQVTFNGSRIATCHFLPGIEVRTIEVAEADGDPQEWLSTVVLDPREEVPDLGEVAYWNADNDQLGVLTGHTLLTVAATQVSEGYDSRAVAQALASMALPRLDAEPAAPVVSTGDDLDSCGVLTLQEAEEILGPLTGAPEPFNFGGQDSPSSKACIYRGEFNQAMVDWTRYLQEDEARGRFQDQAGDDLVLDLGDESAWESASLKLVIRRDSVLIVVSIMLPEDARERAIQIGHIAAPRIP